MGTPSARRLGPLTAAAAWSARFGLAMVAAVALAAAAEPLGVPRQAPETGGQLAHTVLPGGAGATPLVVADQLVVEAPVDQPGAGESAPDAPTGAAGSGSGASAPATPAHDLRTTFSAESELCAAGTACLQGAGLVCPPTGLAAESRLSADALRVLRCVRAQFPQVTAFHGVGARPNESDHPRGRAVDVMVPGWERSSGNALGWEVAEWVRANRACLGVSYVIWDALIWSAHRATEGWRPYQHPNGWPDANSLHLNHVHVSVNGSSGSCANGARVAPVPGDDVTDRKDLLVRREPSPTATTATGATVKPHP